MPIKKEWGIALCLLPERLALPMPDSLDRRRRGSFRQAAGQFLKGFWSRPAFFEKDLPRRGRGRSFI